MTTKDVREQLEERKFVLAAGIPDLLRDDLAYYRSTLRLTLEIVDATTELLKYISVTSMNHDSVTDTMRALHLFNEATK